jgi:hypothetical protein
MLGLRAMAGFACAVLLVLFMPIAPTDPTYSFGAARPGGAQAVLSQAAAMHPVALPCDADGGSHDAACCMTGQCQGVARVPMTLSPSAPRDGAEPARYADGAVPYLDGRSHRPVPPPPRA